MHRRWMMALAPCLLALAAFWAMSCSATSERQTSTVSTTQSAGGSNSAGEGGSGQATVSSTSSGIGGNFGTGGGACDSSSEHTYYWILGQLPDQTTAYVYARSGTKLTFDGTIGAPVTVEVPADSFESYNVGTLGYAQSGTDWYFLDVTGDCPFMINFDRSAPILVNESQIENMHGDTIHDKPPMSLGQSFTFSFGQSSPIDDHFIVYAPDETNVTVQRIVNTGESFSLTTTVTGLYVSDIVQNWLGPNGEGYALTVTSDKPIACGLFDELPNWPNTAYGSGYYFGQWGQTTLYDEYMHIHFQGQTIRSYFLPGANTLTHRDATGATVGDPLAFNAPTSMMVDYSLLGYPTFTTPYLVRVSGTAPFADVTKTPTATDVRADAAYMGWNASLALLQIYATAPTDVTIYDAQTDVVLATLSLDTNEIYSSYLEALGFAADAPFLVAVSATRPVFQEISIPYYLRQYPGEVGPPIPE